jgi:hypothetical protein
MARDKRGRKPRWPEHLATYDPDQWRDKLQWHWARLEAGPALGFEPLPLHQAVARATLDPECNPFIAKRP